MTAKETTTPDQARADNRIEQLKEAGFTVRAEDGGRVRISKHGCAAVLQPSASGDPEFAIRPGLEVRAATGRERANPVLPVGAVPALSGVEGSASERANDLRPEQETSEAIAHLVDRGFQKFWQEGERRLPALSAQLHALHQFDQDLRAVMGLTALYNEALGTVSSRYIYDRLEGREKSKRHQPF